MLKNLVISGEDESSPEEMTDEEVQAELVEDFKNNMRVEFKKNLLGKNDYPKDPFGNISDEVEPFDITSELEDEASELDSNDEDDELVEVLTSLGYKLPDIKSVIPNVDKSLKIEDQIKEALKLMLK